MFRNFSQRLKRDLKHIVDSRVASSESASGSYMKVSPRVSLSRRDLLTIPCIL